MERFKQTWGVFSAAPHRMFFWGGAGYAVLVVALWTVQQASLYTGLLAPFTWTLPYPQAHGFMMVYGLFGFYFFGFLLTTFPRWLDTAPVPRGVYVTAWVLAMAGAHGFWIGLFVSAGLSVAAAVLLLAGYGLATWQCLRTLRVTANPDRYQQVVICGGLMLGMTGIALFAWAAWSGDAALGSLTLRHLGVYAFLLPVVLAVTHRMVPFFTSTVTPGYTLRRWKAVLYWLTAAALLRAVLGASGHPEWSWPADLALLAGLSAELFVWRIWRAPRIPLLRVLYLGEAWIWVAFALSAGQSWHMWRTGLPFAPFGNAALHALAVGGLGTLLVGISTRVTLGHSGRGLATDRLTAALFYAFQIVPLARVAPEVLSYWVPALAVHGFWSGAGWVAVFGIWFAAFGPVLMRPRTDGRPG